MKRKPWKWTTLMPLTVEGFRRRPWLISAIRYEDEALAELYGKLLTDKDMREELLAEK